MILFPALGVCSQWYSCYTYSTSIKYLSFISKKKKKNPFTTFAPFSGTLFSYLKISGKCLKLGIVWLSTLVELLMAVPQSLTSKRHVLKRKGFVLKFLLLG